MMRDGAGRCVLALVLLFGTSECEMVLCGASREMFCIIVLVDAVRSWSLLSGAR